MLSLGIVTPVGVAVGIAPFLVMPMLKFKLFPSSPFGVSAASPNLKAFFYLDGLRALLEALA